MKSWLVMVDIDKTIANSPSLNIHPDNQAEWAAALSRPIRAINAAVRALTALEPLVDVAFVSGRPVHVDAMTRKWLKRYLPRCLAYKLHLCPGGSTSSEFKTEMFRRYRREYADNICAIDDVRYPGPKHFFRAPGGWPSLLEFVRRQLGQVESSETACAFRNKRRG